MQHTKYGNYISYFFTMLIIIFGAVFLSDIFGNLSVFEVDDLNSTFDSYPLLKEENGRYVCNFLSRVFCLYIPKFLHIHIQDAANTIGLTMFIVIIFLTAGASASFWFIKEKSIAIFNLLLILGLFLFAIYQDVADVMYSSIFSFQYGYALATCFGLCFLCLLFNYFANYHNNPEEASSPKHFKKYIFPVLISFCAGNSVQIMVYACSVTVVLFYLYTVIENKFNFKICKDILFNRNIILPVGAFIFGAALMVSCPGFWKELSWRHAESFQQIIDIFYPFMKAYNIIVIENNAVYFYIILSLIVLVLIKDIIIKQDIKCTIRNIFFALFPVMGICLYYFSLISLGASFPDENIKFWVYEPFYVLPSQMVIFASFCFLLGYFFQGTKSLKIKFIAVSLIFAVIIVLCCYYDYFEKTKEMFLQKKNDRALIRKNMYVCDKFILTQYNQKDIIVLPDYCKKYTILDNSYQIDRYYKTAYSLPFYKEVIYTDEKEAMEIFHSLGGTISEEELNKTKFADLMKNTKE